MQLKRFLDLKIEERGGILSTMSADIGFPQDVLEKDVWVCWALDKLFSMPDKPDMAFKGGTSLSKAYGLIDRFSEDIDVTVDLFTDEDIDLTEQVNRSQAKKRRKTLEGKLKEYRDQTLVPYFQEALWQSLGDTGDYEVTTTSDGGQETEDHLYIHYPSAVSSDGSSAVKRRIQFDLGARNFTEPNSTIEIATYLSEYVDTLEFPSAAVEVLDPVRTFWEKVTHIHSMCQMNAPRRKSENQSRHWYDVAQIYKHAIGEAAISDKSMMESVVNYKKTYRYDRGANYDLCLEKSWTLVPSERYLPALLNDYNSMSGYFLRNQPSFAYVMITITELQNKLNE